jgi:hypothetical protein
MYSLSKRSLKQMVGMNPALSFAVTMAIGRTMQDFGVLNMGGIRTQEQQDELYAKGRTAPGKKVTWTRNSRHVSGNAVDLVAFVDGKPTWDEQYYPEIIRAMKSVIKDYNLKIDHGFDLWGKDIPHWQISHSDYELRELL